MSSTSKIIRRPVQVLLIVPPRQVSLAFTSDQLSGMDGCIAESASIELPGPSADAGGQQRGPGGQQ